MIITEDCVYCDICSREMPEDEAIKKPISCNPNCDEIMFICSECDNEKD